MSNGPSFASALINAWSIVVVALVSSGTTLAVFLAKRKPDAILSAAQTRQANAQARQADASANLSGVEALEKVADIYREVAEELRRENEICRASSVRQAAEINELRGLLDHDREDCAKQIAQVKAECAVHIGDVETAWKTKYEAQGARLAELEAIVHQLHPLETELIKRLIC